MPLLSLIYHPHTHRCFFLLLKYNYSLTHSYKICSTLQFLFQKCSFSLNIVNIAKYLFFCYHISLIQAHWSRQSFSSSTQFLYENYGEPCHIFILPACREQSSRNYSDVIDVRPQLYRLEVNVVKLLYMLYLILLWLSRDETLQPGPFWIVGKIHCLQ